MKWFDDHTQDVARKRLAWDDFASSHGGTCRLIRTQDHVYQRLELTVPRPGYAVVFGESDKQNWRATVTGMSAQMEAFSIAPRGPVDNLLRLVHREKASFTDAILRGRFVVDGAGGEKAVRIIETPSIKDGVLKLGSLYLVLIRQDGGFALKALPDPIHGFEGHGAVMLEVLDGLMKGLVSSGVLV
jgi:hypothetical protein